MTAPASHIVREDWAYAGVRYTPDQQDKDKLIDYWFSDHGLADESLWSVRRLGGTRYVIGGVYAIRVSRVGTTITRHGAPRYTGNFVADTQRMEWSAMDARARLERQRRLDQLNKHRADVIDQALAPLDELLKSLRTHAEREALLVTVMRRIMISN